MNVIKKQSTWSRLQERVPENKAFYDLSSLEILTAFDLVEEYSTGNYALTIHESYDLITITLTER